MQSKLSDSCAVSSIIEKEETLSSKLLFLFSKFIPFRLSVLVLAFLSNHAFAFKIDTHVTIAQEVIKDIMDDGMVSIKVGDQIKYYSIPKDIVNAISENQSYFRMGSIGPDGVPGILSGQTVIHPGAEDPNGWGTGEWLNFLKSQAQTPNEKAFAAGFFVHAASDTFAHTYVNHYSGRVWDLADETYSERRHFLLESFIASKNPPIQDRLGNNLGEVYSVLKQPSGELAIPKSFLANALIFNSTAASKMSESAPHLSFLYHHEKALENIERDVRKLANLIERIALESYTGIILNEEQMEKLRSFINKLNTSVVPLDEIREFSNWVTSLKIDLVEEQARMLKDALELLVKAYEEYINLTNQLFDAANELSKIDLQYHATVNTCKAAHSLNKTQCEFEGEACSFVNDIFGKIAGKTCEAVTKLNPQCWTDVQKVYWEALRACEVTAEALSLKSQVDSARKTHVKINQKVIKSLADVNSIIASIESIIIEYYELENNTIQNLINLYDLMLADINPVLTYLISWRKSVKVAGEEFIMANGNAIVNSITPNASLMDPLTSWLKCYTWSLAGLPYPIGDGLCDVIDAKNKILAELKSALEILSKINPLDKVILELIEKIESEIKQITQEAIIEVFERTTGEPVRELLEIISEPGTPSSITFAYTNGEKFNLRSIPDAAFRIGAEMNLQNGAYDVDTYPVIYNAIVLSKLSLLDASELSKLAKDAGVEETKYGNNLYDGSNSSSSNILTGSLRSIDGSHQWRTQAMPFLTTFHHSHAPYARFSYDPDLFPEKGFRPWLDTESRNKLFREIFIGPLVAGIDAPDVIGFPPILHDQYPYSVCAENPFPDDNDPLNPDVMIDQTCNRIRLKNQLDEKPGATLVDMEKVRNVHRDLTDTLFSGIDLMSADHWDCQSKDFNLENNLKWEFIFNVDGSYSISIKKHLSDDPGSIGTTYAFVHGTFEIVGDFLFTFPKGKGVLNQGEENNGIPSLDRRFTEQPQRYWVESLEGEKDQYYLWNEDGSLLSCNGTVIPEQMN